MTYARCEHDGCERAAQFAPKICVPAMGWPLDEKRALQATLGVRLCREHCEEFPAADQFKADAPGALREVFKVMARAAGSFIPPDFKRAWVKPVPLDGEEWATFTRVRAQRAQAK